MVLITTFNWIIVKVKCIWKYFLAYKFYRELYIHKSTMYYNYRMFLILKSQGEKIIPALFQRFSIDHETRTCSQNSYEKCVPKKKITELGSLEAWFLSPAFPWTHHKAPGKSLRFPGTPFPSLYNTGCIRWSLLL